VRQRFAYWAFRIVILIMRPVPLRLAYRVAGGVAVLCYLWVFPRHRRGLKANLRQVLPDAADADIERIARQGFRNFGKYVIDVIHFPTMTREEVRRRLRFDQWDELNEMRDSGRGVVIATLHFGNWDLGGAALAACGYRINAIAERFDYEPMNTLVQGSRARLGMTIIAGDRTGPRVFRLLKDGQFLAMLIDVVDEQFAVEVEFFGAPARVSAAPARIALRTGAWVMPAVVLRDSGDDTIIRPVIGAELRDFTPSGDEAADVRALTQAIVRWLEPQIRAHIEQWFIMTPIWRTSDGSEGRDPGGA